ncbi:SUMO ligase siz1, partial [Ascosphaera aggregata]
MTANRLTSPETSNIRVMVYCAVDNGLTPFTKSDITFPQQVDLKVNFDSVPAKLRGLKNKPGTTNPADVTQYIRKKAGYQNKIDMIYALTSKLVESSIRVVRRYVDNVLKNTDYDTEQVIIEPNGEWSVHGQDGPAAAAASFGATRPLTPPRQQQEQHGQMSNFGGGDDGDDDDPDILEITEIERPTKMMKKEDSSEMTPTAFSHIPRQSQSQSQSQSQALSTAHTPSRSSAKKRGYSEIIDLTLDSDDDGAASSTTAMMAEATAREDDDDDDGDDGGGGGGDDDYDEDEDEDPIRPPKRIHTQLPLHGTSTASAYRLAHPLPTAAAYGRCLDDGPPPDGTGGTGGG